jgi:tight adherence protein B
MSTRGESLVAYGQPAGVLVLVIGAAVSVVAYRVMVRIGRLPEDGRVLR